MKKILIFSHNCISSTLNNGKTLLNIFSSFPKESLGQLYISDLDSPDFSNCENYFRISDSDLLHFKSGNIINKSTRFSKENQTKRTAFSNTNGLRKSLTMLARNMIWFTLRWNSKSLSQWIVDNQFDTMFFVGGNYSFSHSMAQKISKRYKLKLVTYFTDDYVIYVKPKNIIDKYLLFKLKRAYHKTIGMSDKLFGIGEDLCNEYGKLFNKEFYPIMNCIDNYSSMPNELDIKQLVNFTYLGGLHLNRWESLIKLSKIIVCTLPMLNFEINIYTATVLDTDILDKLKRNNIKLHKPVSSEMVPSILEKANILIHAESTSVEMIQMTKLSVSTKIPECLISRRLLVAIGPRNVASIRLIEKNNLGVVIDPLDENTFSNLKNILLHSNKISEITEAAYSFAMNNFLRTKVSDNFKKTLNK